MTLVRSILASLAGYLVATGLGCASAPDPLRTALAVSAVTVAGIDAALVEHNVRLLAEIQRREALCPPPPGKGRDACLMTAGAEVRAAFAPEETRLRQLKMFQYAAGVALRAARKCREEQLACEGAKLKEAEGSLAAAQAGLTVPAPAGGAGGAR